MNSNTLNAIAVAPEDLITLLEKIAGIYQSSSQVENATLFFSNLKINPAILDVVDACENISGP